MHDLFTSQSQSVSWVPLLPSLTWEAGKAAYPECCQPGRICGPSQAAVWQLSHWPFSPLTKGEEECVCGAHLLPSQNCCGAHLHTAGLARLRARRTRCLQVVAEH